jgi:hypothetical protein
MKWLLLLTILSGYSGSSSARLFGPRIPPSVVMPRGTREAISVYDTGPLQATLNELRSTAEGGTCGSRLVGRKGAA